MYKWFFWSARKRMYVPVPGLFSFPRSFYPAICVDYFGYSIPSWFSIPMFNKHNAVKP